jgi:starch phosphorylase
MEFLPKKTFTVVPNGANPRRWIYNANRPLAELIKAEVGDESEWLVDLNLLSTTFAGYLDDLAFLHRFLAIRAQNKRRLLSWIEKKTGQTHFREGESSQIQDVLFDIMVKRVDENKR